MHLERGPRCVDWCPSRGVALTHMRDRDCKDGHTDSQCCHCGKQITHPAECRHNQPSSRSASKDERIRLQEPTKDHVYRWTMGGRCAANDCGATEDEHPLESALVPAAGCVESHTNASKTLLIGDAGPEWTLCHGCGVYLEPKQDMIGAQGPNAGPGRGVFTERHLRKLDFIAVQGGYGVARP